MLEPSKTQSIFRFKGKSRHERTNGAHLFFCLLAFLMLSYQPIVNAKPLRLELASGFHQADPLFGGQLSALIAKLKASKISKMRLRQSRKAMGASSAQMIDLIQVGSIDGALVDPVKLGYRPAIAQIFGGIPFGPAASQIAEWSSSSTGRGQVVKDFEAIGVHPLLCGHGDSYSGVFARELFKWPAESHESTVHARGMGEDIYQGLGFLTRQLPAADLYMGYATGVTDLLVSPNPSMDARAGFAQVSDYFYYPSWERNSAFALLLIGSKAWQSYPDSAREAIAGACEAMNSQPAPNEIESTLIEIRQQGAGDTIVEPWPTKFTADAYAQWRDTAAKLLKNYPSLAPAFQALRIPGDAR